VPAPTHAYYSVIIVYLFGIVHVSTKNVKNDNISCSENRQEQLHPSMRYLGLHLPFCRPGATLHKAACEDGGEMAVFQQLLAEFAVSTGGQPAGSLSENCHTTSSKNKLKLSINLPIRKKYSRIRTINPTAPPGIREES